MLEMNIDPMVMLVVQISILLFTIYAAIRDLKTRNGEKNAGAVPEVTRGDGSMAGLYTAYGATIASCLVLIDAAGNDDDHCKRRGEAL